MGLEERRLIKTIESEDLPRFQSELNGIVGAETPLEVDWDSLTQDSAKRLERFRTYAIPQFINGVNAIARDDMGKEALASSVNKVVFKHDGTVEKLENIFTLDAGILTVRWNWDSDAIYTNNHVEKLVSAML